MSEQFNGIRLFPDGYSLRAMCLGKDGFRTFESGETLTGDLARLTRWLPLSVESEKRIEITPHRSVSLLHFNSLLLPAPVLRVRYFEPKFREAVRMVVSATLLLYFEESGAEDSPPPPVMLASLSNKFVIGPGGLESVHDLTSPCMRWQTRNINAGKFHLRLETTYFMTGAPSIEAGSYFSASVEFGSGNFFILPTRLFS